MAAFDPFVRRGVWPDGLSAVGWVKQAPAVAGLEDGRALAQALGKLEALYKKIDVDDLRPRKGQAFDTLDALDEAERQAKAAYRSTVVPLIAQCLEVRKQAVNVAKQAQSNPGIPRPMVALTAEVAQLAGEVADGFKDLALVFSPFDDARKGLVKAGDHLRKTLLPHLQALDKGLDLCLKAPSRQAWDKSCKDPCKALHNAIRNTASLKDELWPIWKVHDGDSFSHALQMAEKSAKDDKAKQKLEDVVTRMCKDLKKEIKRVEDLLA